MNTPRFRTESGGLTAALTRKVFYTHKTIHGTDGSRTAITTGPTNGAVMCFDPFAHESDKATYPSYRGPGVGECVTQCVDGAIVDNRSMVAGYLVNARGTLSAPGWVDVIPPVKGSVFDCLCKANASIITPTYLKPVTATWELAAATVDGTTPADEMIVQGVAMETADTSTTAARKPVCFV